MTGHLNKTSPFLNATVIKLNAQHQQEGNRIRNFVLDMLQRNPNMRHQYSRPASASDTLFQTVYTHLNGETCETCDGEMAVKRPLRATEEVQVHYGTIGSSNSVIRDAVKRDKLRDGYGIIGVEMEAAAIMDLLPSLIVRGVCDYADSHKNKSWQPYAAAVAAGDARELLRSVPSEASNQTKRSYTTTCDAHPALEFTGTAPTPSPGALLTSLAFTRMDVRSRNISDALSSTCEWLFSHNQFERWINEDETHNHNGFLWIKGKPGSDKSTVMKALWNWEKKSHPHRTTLVYFFNARAPGELEKSSSGLYRSLCHQLLLAVPTLQASFSELFSFKGNDSFTESWTINELQSFLNYVVKSQPDLPLTVLIDALDEGSDDDVRHLVSFLEDLALRASLTGSHLRICLSSRHYPHISVKTGLSLTLENQTGHDDDIKKYVQKRLLNDQSHVSRSFRDQVCQKSAGIFLWVVLAVPMLNKIFDKGRGVQETTRCLEEIPAGLDGLFAKILDRSAEDINQCVALLQWMLFSWRPLEPMELYIAINSDSLPLSLYETDITAERLNLYLLNTSRGLIEMTKTEPFTIQFIHETVREFLQHSSSSLSKVDSRLAENLTGTCHDEIKATCLAYITENVMSVSTLEYREMTVLRRSKGKDTPRLSFLHYCVEHMFEHADVAEGNGNPQILFFKELNACDNAKLQDWILIRKLFQPYKIREYTCNASLMYVIAHRGLNNLVKVLPDQEACDCDRGERFGAALQAACAAGHDITALVLLQAGADINAEGGECGNALSAAVRFRHESLARVLLRHGAKSTPEAIKPFLFATIARGHLSGVKLLVKSGASVSEKDCEKGTPLEFAFKNGQFPIVAWLLENGSLDVDADAYRCLLSYLKSGNQFKSASGTFSTEVSSNVENSRCEDALRKALHQARPRIAHLLYETCDLFHRRTYNRDEEHQTASETGHAFTVKPLTKREQIRRRIVESVFQAALQEGHVDVVRALLTKEADLYNCRGRYGIALQTASWHGHKQVVRFLIGKGADINATGGRVGNALRAASRRGHEEIVRILIEKGADIDIREEKFGTALDTAARSGHDKIVKLLIAGGAC